eukprot:gene2645-3050_t
MNESTRTPPIGSSAERSDADQQAVTLSFKDLSYTVQTKKKTMTLLKGISGSVSPGELVALLGPSGSGKTTLLDILANRKETGEISGTVLINGNPFGNEYKRLCSYVVQEDILLPTITVRETLRFYADLKLPSNLTTQQREERVQGVLEQIGLVHKADSKIGGMLPGGIMVRGLSGGEKRRVTIGCALVTSPSIMLLDEPTSGLDTTSAMSVMRTLVQLIRDKNITIICSIHQPRPEIYRLFTKVLVLTEGRLVYFADYILDAVTQIKESKLADEIGDRLAPSYSALVGDSPSGATVTISETSNHDAYNTSAYNSSFLRQFIVLWKRTGKDFMRNPGNSIIRFSVAGLIGLLFGACFANLSMTPKGMQSRASVLFFLSITMVLQPFCSISLFISKRILFNAERASRLYHTLPYFLATMFFEFLACLITVFVQGTIAYWFSDLNNDIVDSSFAIGSGVVTVYQLFAGFFVTIDSLPRAFGWLRYINFIYYTFEALMVNEFQGRQGDCGQPDDRSTCPPGYSGSDFIEHFGMEGSRKVWTVPTAMGPEGQTALLEQFLKFDMKSIKQGR